MKIYFSSFTALFYVYFKKMIYGVYMFLIASQLCGILVMSTYLHHLYSDCIYYKLITKKSFSFFFLMIFNKYLVEKLTGQNSTVLSN